MDYLPDEDYEEWMKLFRDGGEVIVSADEVREALRNAGPYVDSTVTLWSGYTFRLYRGGERERWIVVIRNPHTGVRTEVVRSYWVSDVVAELIYQANRPRYNK